MFHSKVFLSIPLLLLLLGFLFQLAIFDLVLLGSFERLLGPSSFECPQAPLIQWQICLPIFSGRLGFIFGEGIAQVAYLGSWALVVSSLLLGFY